MLRLEKVSIRNVSAISKLSVTEAQKYFVASNNDSIIDTYTAIIENRHVFSFGVYEGDTMVGFVMAGYDYKNY